MPAPPPPAPVSAFFKYKKEYIKTLLQEIKHFYRGETLKTLYFGGGTPSLLEISEIDEILNCFNIDNKTEITLEANPDSVDFKKLCALKSSGINRLSLGVQSFDDKILKSIGRLHSSSDAFQAIEDVSKIFDNYTIDLMYGLPRQTFKSWQNTLKKACELKIPHISLYGLKIEDGTLWSKNPPKRLPSLDMQAKMQEYAFDFLEKNYRHYEFSNFALNKQYFSCHNLAYWTRQNYYGFGLSASGFIKNARYTNTSNLIQYLKNPLERNYENLTLQEQIEEEIFLGLRLFEGINFKKTDERYNIELYKKYQKTFEKFLNLKMLEKTQNGVRLTRRGVMLSNIVLSEFIENA